MNLITIEARTSSKRLPGKVLKKLNGKPIVQIIYEKCKKSMLFDECVVATTKSKSDDNLVNFLRENEIPFYRGEEENVWKRLVMCCENYRAINLIKLTGDNPFIDIKIIEEAFEYFQRNQPIDILTASIKRSLPIGLDFEILKVNCLINQYSDSRSNYDKEHATTFLKEKCKRHDYFPKKSIPPDFIKNVELTIDTKSDYDFANHLISLLNENIDKIDINMMVDLFLNCNIKHTSNRKWDKGI